MKQTRRACVLLTISLLASLALASSVRAAGVNLRWTRCFGEGIGPRNKSFACNTNVGTDVLVASFVMDADLPQVSGIELAIDLNSDHSTLDPWWQYKNVGTCRSTALNCNGTANIDDVVCQDWGAGIQTTALAQYAVGSAIPGEPWAAPSQARILAVAVVPPTALANLTGGTEYFALNTTITHVKTVGTGLCAGCNDPVCLVLSSIKIATPCGAACDRKLSGPSNGTDSNFCSWQGSNCIGVPTRNRTWGEVKSLYRN